MNQLIILHVWVFCVSASVYRVCSASGGKKVHHVPWDWSSRWLWAITWVLGLQPGSSGWSPNALNCQVILLALLLFVLIQVLKTEVLNTYILLFLFISVWDMLRKIVLYCTSSLMLVSVVGSSRRSALIKAHMSLRSNLNLHSFVSNWVSSLCLLSFLLSHSTAEILFIDLSFSSG